MTVPLVLHVIPTATARGAQREARALATRLDVPGVRHHRVLSLTAGTSGVPVDITLRHPAGSRPGEGFDPRLVVRLRRELRRLHPAVVVAHGGDPLKYIVPALVGLPWPLAYYATGTFEHAARSGRVRLWRRFVRRADVVACEGQEVLDQVRALLAVPSSRSVLAPNGRDPDQFHPPARPRSEGPPALVFVGALTDGKRPTRFVSVVAQLRDRGMAVRAVVCGDGPRAGELAGPASAAGVDMLGSRSDVPEVLRASDVLVFPSLPTGEGMPGVLIEAGLSGLPVVATAVPGVASVVEDGVTGFVVEPDDERAMVDATAALVGDEALRHRMGEAARARCMAHFSLETVAATWLGFLAPLLAREQTRRQAQVDRRPTRWRRGRSGPDGRPDQAA